MRKKTDGGTTKKKKDHGRTHETPLRELSLFAGAGGGILAGTLLGWRTVCAVEIEPFCRGILMARQRDGLLPPFPVFEDVRRFDGKPWRGRADVVSGGFPCQDISVAGKGAGIDGERSGLWREFARIVGDVRPRFAFVENSPMLVRRGLARILGDLAALGYDAEWEVLGAADVGASHRRDRLWILARRADALPDAAGVGREALDDEAGDARQMLGEETGRKHLRTGGVRDAFPDAADEGIMRRNRELSDAGEVEGGRENHGGGTPFDGGGEWWRAESRVDRVAYGVPARMDRLVALGNAQVPLVAAAAFTRLAARFGEII